MPSARHAQAGETSLSYHDMNEYYRYTLSVQLYDWLHASAFYLRVPNRLYSNSPTFSGDTIYTDKGFDIKARILPESRYVPEVSVGLIDMAGTGLLSGEYIAASKAVGPFDFTLGLGFGRLGSADHVKNPLCHVTSAFCQRPRGFSGGGGKFEYDQWFRGSAGIFAGVEYQTPINGLRIKVEYESNNYSQDRAGVDITQSTPINLGLNWRVNNNLDVGLSYERGNTLAFGFNLRTNFNRQQQVRLEQPRTPAVLSSEGQTPHASTMQNVNWHRIEQQLAQQRAYSYSEFTVSPAQQSESAQPSQRVTLYTHPFRLRQQEEKLDRTARILLAELPNTVSEIEIVEQTSLQPVVAYQINANAYRSIIANENPEIAPHHARSIIQRSEPTSRPPAPSRNEDGSYNTVDSEWAWYYPKKLGKPRFGFQPSIQQGYGSPETFLFYQVLADAFSSWQINQHWNLYANVGINIYNNYDKFNFTVDSHQSNVPRVRTYAREYMQNDIWLDTAQASYYRALTPAWHVNMYGGLLERMYGGVGGELMYRPLNSAFAYGVDINRVRQRDFKSRFDFRDYEVTTGFASLYYDIGQHVSWLPGSHITASFGQFLAGDKGVHLNFQRRFDSGVLIGAFAALTDMSTAEFGEGSFNKGLYISVPFDLFTVRSSRSRTNFAWSPLTRDGGQRLQTRSNLYFLTNERSPFIHQ